jgi:hypothetical protein
MSPTPARLLQLRVWAAEVRDSAATAEQARLARTLVNLLDLRPRLEAKNGLAALDSNVALFVGRLIVAGAAGPR